MEVALNTQRRVLDKFKKCIDKHKPSKYWYISGVTQGKNLTNLNKWTFVGNKIYFILLIIHLKVIVPHVIRRKEG